MLQLNRQGAFKFRWPTTEEGIITDTEKWITYESSRSAADQLKDPWLAQMQAQYALAINARTLAQMGEAARTEASDAYRKALDQARALLQRALAYLKFKHADNLAQIEHWGWNARLTQRGGYTVKMPTKDADLIRLLEIYVAYEATRGPEQISDPPLPTLQALLVDIHDLAQNVGSSRTQRTSNIFERSQATHKLQDLLQVSGLVICMLYYDGEVHPDLAKWGYTIIAATPPETEEEPPETEPPV